MKVRVNQIPKLTAEKCISYGPEDFGPFVLFVTPFGAPKPIGVRPGRPNPTWGRTLRPKTRPNWGWVRVGSGSIGVLRKSILSII